MSQRVESSHWYFHCYFFWNAVGLWPSCWTQKMNRQDLRNFDDAITIFCTFTLDPIRERNHLLTQMIWQNNFREKKSFFFWFNQNGKIPISCPFLPFQTGRQIWLFILKRGFSQKTGYLASEFALWVARCMSWADKLKCDLGWPNSILPTDWDNYQFCFMNSSFAFASTGKASKTVNVALLVANGMIQSCTSIKT